MYSNIDSNKVLLSEFAVRCRTGSLEIWSLSSPVGYICALPHRQLRKQPVIRDSEKNCALPHRQLRNLAYIPYA